MIKEIQINNFQGHRSTFLELSKGINIITGASDVGKSSIRRAIEWCFFNRPQGNKYHSWFAEYETTSVAISFDDDSFVIRERQDDKKKIVFNRYLTPDHDEDDPLEALGTDVPQQVKSIIRIDDTNVQGQHDRYFLLEKSPGERGRLLNDFVGLDIIDKSLSNIKREISTAKKDIDKSTEQIDKLKEELKTYKFLDAFEIDLNRIEKLLNDRDKIREERRELSIICSRLSKIDIEMEELNIWLEIENEVSDLLKQINEIDMMIRERKSLSNLIDRIESIDNEIKESEIDPSGEVAALAEEIRQWKKEDAELDELYDLIEEIEAKDEEIEKIEIREKELIKEKDILMKDIGYCPTCNRPFEK